MKKNIRIVSAAATALLAVAPVAVSTVSTVNAAEKDSQSSAGSEALKMPTASKVAQSWKNLATKKVTITGSTMSSLFTENSLSSTEMQALGFPDGVVARNNRVITVADNNNSKGLYTQTLTFHAYWPKSNNGSKPAAPAGYEWKEGTSGYTLYSGNSPVIYTVDRQVTGINEQGTPYFYVKTDRGNFVVEDGKASIDLAQMQTSTFTAQDLLNQFNKKYGFGHNAGKAQVEMTTDSASITKELEAQGLKHTANGDFDYPASQFHFTVTIKSENGKTASLNVTVRHDEFNINNPSFTVGNLTGNIFDNAANKLSNRFRNGSDLSAAELSSFFYDKKTGMPLPINTILEDIEGATGAYVSGNTSNNDRIPAHQIKWDDSAIKNATHTGFYPLTATVTNPAGYTSKITFHVLVASNFVNVSSTQWVKNDVKTVTINGNKVTETNHTLKKGDKVKTWGKVNIDGKTYTRVGDTVGSTEFVPTDSLSTTEISSEPAQPAKPAEVAKTGDKYIMTNSTVYNEKSVSLGKKIYAFTDQAVYGEKTINGKKYYRVSGTAEEYIKASNVKGEGTLRTLKHNAYIYATSKKRANKKVLKKGTTVRTYGYSHKFKNGKKYYRIEGATASKKMYVKVANFK